MMKRFITIALAALSTAMIMAQQPRGPHMSHEEFRAKLEQEIAQKAELTAEESAALFPLFHEMKKKQMEVGRKQFRLKQQAPAADRPDNEYADAIQKVKGMQVRMAKVEEEYYKRMCSVVSAKKVYRVMLADDQIHRDMLSRFNGRRDGKSRNDGRQEHK